MTQRKDDAQLIMKDLLITVQMNNSYEAVGRERSLQLCYQLPRS